MYEDINDILHPVSGPEPLVNNRQREKNSSYVSSSLNCVISKHLEELNTDGKVSDTDAHHLAQKNSSEGFRKGERCF